MIEVQIEEIIRSDLSRPKDYERAVVVDAAVSQTNKTTLRSERSGALKKRKRVTEKLKKKQKRT
jgi:hypothetical protein